MRGGARPGSGRKKGGKNQSTKRRDESLQRAISMVGEHIANAFEGDSHALLMVVYKNQDLPLAIRLDAAKAAIAYEKPKLSSVEHKGDAENPLETVTTINLIAPDHGDGTDSTST